MQLVRCEQLKTTTAQGLNPTLFSHPPILRYEQPKCDNTARAHPAKARDLYKNRPLQGEYSVHGVKGVLSPLRTTCNVA